VTFLLLFPQLTFSEKVFYLPERGQCGKKWHSDVNCRQAEMNIKLFMKNLPLPFSPIVC